MNELRRRVSGPSHPLFKAKTLMVCEVCGAERQVKPSLVARFRFCSRNCAGAWVTRNNPRVSSIEDAVAAVLDDLGIRYERQGRVRSFTPDFVVGKTIIEVDGDYWHAIPQVRDRDARKDAVYAEEGFRVVRLTEHAIRAGDFSGLDVLKDRA